MDPTGRKQVTKPSTHPSGLDSDETRCHRNCGHHAGKFVHQKKQRVATSMPYRFGDVSPHVPFFISDAIAAPSITATPTQAHPIGSFSFAKHLMPMYKQVYESLARTPP